MRPNRYKPECFTITWRGITCRVTHERDYRNEGWSLLQLRVISPSGAPVPLAEGGYLRHEVDHDHIVAAGSASTYLRSLLEREAQTVRYAKDVERWNQFDLFGR